MEATKSPNPKAEIDQLDLKILQLLGRRFELAREVATQGGEAEEGVESLRSTAVFERCVELGRELGLPEGLARRLYRDIIETSWRVEDELSGHGPVAGDQQPATALARSAISIDHVAIAVEDLDLAVKTFCDRFGFCVSERQTVRGVHSGMESAVLKAGEIKFVLVEGTSPASNVSQYIEHYGPGVQHVALRIDDLEAVLADLQRRDCDLLTGVIHSPGLDQLFTRRDANSGMQIEIIARADNDDFSNSNVTELFEAMERENVF
jgi:methylmalonyl-CoA epimerase